MSLPPPARPASRAGFTLTEMMVVIAILTILAGLLYTGVMGVLRTAHRRRTTVTLTLLAAAIDQYEAMGWGDYPPGDGGLSGAESLYAALSSTAGGGPFLPQGGVPVRDTDGNGRPEFLDDWRRPIRYTHHRHYSGEPMADSYRLESAGQDGVPGTRDDINNWK